MQLLASPRFGDMMKTLKEKFDIILVDSPPVGVIIDAMEIAKSCDGAVLVVEYNNGRSQDIGEVAAGIARTGCPVLGAVMNGVDLKSFGNRKYYYRSERYAGYYRCYGKNSRKPAKRSAAKRTGKERPVKEGSESKRRETKSTEEKQTETKATQQKRAERKRGRGWRALFDRARQRNEKNAGGPDTRSDTGEDGKAQV